MMVQSRDMHQVVTESGTWRVADLADGSWVILDEHGTVAARFSDAATMACHFAMLLEEKRRTRGDNWERGTYG